MSFLRNSGDLGRRLAVLIMIVVSMTGTIARAQDNNYEIGVGIADITGEVVETPYFGYADPFLASRGLRDRQYARAFIIKEPGGEPVIFVSIDKGAMFQSVNQFVMDKLQERYGGLYRDENVVISATHTHVAAGGHSHYTLYQISTGGYYKTNFDVAVAGIVKAIDRAHANIAAGRIYLNRGTLTNASVQRSMPAFLANTDASKYPSIDDQMTVLKFVQGANTEVGVIAWFAVHPTSLPKSWDLSSADNKGYASNRFEKLKGSSYGASGAFVAAFAQSNAGDMSPNLNQPPEDDHTTDATGPGDTPEESLRIIGERQFQTALSLYDSASEQLTGSVSFISRYSDFSDLHVDKTFADGISSYTTCPAALGASFFAGAEDGRSGISREGLTKNPDTGDALGRCHAEKPIALALAIDPSAPASPNILPTTLFKIGQLGILAASAEFTITAGRRARAVVEAVEGAGITETVFSGYADAYSGYVATREEYATQQYEGAATHFGPWTHAAYLQEFWRLASKIADPWSDPWGEVEPIAPERLAPLDRTTAVFFDTVPSGLSFGSVKADAQGEYSRGATVQVVFWGAHPNNRLNTDSSYFRIQRLAGSSWVDVAFDRDQNTKFEWERYSIADSLITVTWDIPGNAAPGQYRIRHDGGYKNIFGVIANYTGYSRTFSVR